MAKSNDRASTRALKAARKALGDYAPLWKTLVWIAHRSEPDVLDRVREADPKKRMFSAGPYPLPWSPDGWRGSGLYGSEPYEETPSELDNKPDLTGGSWPDNLHQALRKLYDDVYARRIVANMDGRPGFPAYLDFIRRELGAWYPLLHQLLVEEKLRFSTDDLLRLYPPILPEPAPEPPAPVELAALLPDCTSFEGIKTMCRNAYASGAENEEAAYSIVQAHAREKGFNVPRGLFDNARRAEGVRGKSGRRKKTRN